MITGVVLARNEERNIVECLTCLRPNVAEIILIDMESDDRTVDLARPFVTRVLSHPVVNRFDAARNLAIDVATYEWMWFVDADERIPAATGEWVNHFVRDHGDTADAVWIPFKSYFCGKWIQHCGWWPGFTMPRVLKRGHFSFSQRLHGGVDVDGRQLRVEPNPQFAIEHYSYLSIEHYLEKLNRYTTTEAEHLADAGTQWDWRRATRHMMQDLWLYYERNDGKLDQTHGWILSWLSGQYRWLSHAKLLDRTSAAELASNIPASIDEVLQEMEESLAHFRVASPTFPLGIVLKSPIWDPSGYADEGRCFVKALSGGPRLLKLDAVQWTEKECGMNGPDRALLRALLRVRRPQWTAAITNSIPSVVTPDPLASLNIIRTTNETDRIPGYWHKSLEAFDEIWVISRHNERAFRRSGVAPEKLRVVPSFIDTDIYRPDGERLQLHEVLTDRFVFLSVFDWQLRKGWDVLLRAYCQEFSGDERVGLLLKLSRSHGHPVELVQAQADDVLRQCGQSLAERKDIVLWEQQLSEGQMAALYRSVDAFVLPTRGEGWGRPFMEAMASGLPTIGTRASGNIDFMTDDNSVLIGAQLVDVPDEAGREIPIFTGHRWFEPSIDELRSALRSVLDDRAMRTSVSQRARIDIQQQFGLTAGRESLERALGAAEDRIRSSPPRPVEPGQIRVEIEGEFFANHSFSLINEQLGRSLAVDPRFALALNRVQYNPIDERKERYSPGLRALLNRQLPDGPDVTIRHCYPPNWVRPARGRWVHIQPWEWGYLPKSWLAPLVNDVDEIWAPSHFVKRVYERSGVPPDKIVVIPWGVDGSVFHPKVTPRLLPTKKSFRFLFVGGTIHRKGIDILLNAYIREFHRDEDVCLVIKDTGSRSFYQDSTHAAEIQRLAADSSCPEILYMDADLTSGQLASVYTASNCLVSPYRGEGFALPVLEAMSAGIPPIIPRHGPTDDFTSDEFAWRLPATIVETTHDWEACGQPTHLEISVDDLRSAMRQAFESRELEAMGQSAAVHARSMPWSTTLEMMAIRLESLVNNGGASGVAVGIPQTAPASVVSAYIESCADEAQLASCLAHLQPFVDEMVVVGAKDPGLTAIAGEYGARVANSGSGRDLSTQQQIICEQLRSEWVLILSGEEIIDENSAQSLRHLAAASPEAVLGYSGPEKTDNRDDRALRFIRRAVFTSESFRPGDDAVSIIHRLGGAISPANIQFEWSSDYRSRTPRAAAIATFGIGEHGLLLDISLPVMKAYGVKHGFDVIVGDGNSQGRPASWGKVLLLIDLLQRYECVLWLDADTVIVDGIRDIRDDVSPQAMMAMVKHRTIDGEVPNCGVWYLTRRALPLLKTVWAMDQFVHSPWWEQEAVMTLLGYDVSRPTRLMQPTEFHVATDWLPLCWNSHPHDAASRARISHSTYGEIGRRLARMKADAALAAGWISSVGSAADKVKNRDEFGEFLNSRGLIGQAAEVGVQRGEFSRQFLDRWRGQLLHLIDPWRHLTDYQDVANLSDEEHEKLLAETRNRLAHHEGRFRIHRAMSHEAVEQFANQSLDFVFLDANHAYDSVLQDMRLWYAKLRSGGILAGHDFLDGVHPQGEFGVRSAVLRFEQEFEVRAHITPEIHWPSWYLEKP